MWASCIACSVRPSTFLWWSKYRGMAPILLSHLNGGSIAFNALELRCHLSGSCSLTTTSYYLSLPPWRGWLNMLFRARRDLSELPRIPLLSTPVNKGKKKEGPGPYCPGPGRGRSLAAAAGGKGGVKGGGPLCPVNSAGLVGPLLAILQGVGAGTGPGRPVAGAPGGGKWRALDGALKSHRCPTVLHPDGNLAVALIEVGITLGGHTVTLTPSLVLGPIQGERSPRAGGHRRVAQGYRRVVLGASRR